MKSFKSLKKIVTCILVICVCLAMLSGCTKKSASTSTASNSSKNNTRNAAQMKQQMEDNIKSLVTDGTITQAQADQIVNTLTSNTQGFGQRNGNSNGTKNSSSSKNSNSNGNGYRNQNGNSANTNRSSNNAAGANNSSGNGNRQFNGQSGQRPNPLSKLVSDGVITQAQADAVMQKIYGNFRRPQNNQNGQDSSNNQNNQNTQNN